LADKRAQKASTIVAGLAVSHGETHILIVYLGAEDIVVLDSALPPLRFIIGAILALVYRPESDTKATATVFSWEVEFNAQSN
jgi:hypothetical protein